MTSQTESPQTSEPASEQPPGKPAPKSGAGRTIGLVLSSGMLLVGVLILIGGLAVIAAHAFVRDDDGFYTSGNEALESDSYAILTEDIDLSDRAADWAPDEVLGDLRFRAEDEAGGEVFLGIARTGDLEGYLDGVARAEVTGFNGDPRYDELPGRAPEGPPDAESFWAAQSQGTGEQAVQWEAESGNWTAVVMNADGARGIAVEADAGVQISWLLWVGIGLAIVGMAVTGGAVALIAHLRRGPA
jgi:hypothetical protein